MKNNAGKGNAKACMGQSQIKRRRCYTGDYWEENGSAHFSGPLSVACGQLYAGTRRGAAASRRKRPHHSLITGLRLHRLK
ncbi:hypothetical protein EMGBS3_12510 [Anaerolineaceae bacterium]|nr:hypothetical protein EMGBS3_12510 [Anaerolineaceae bacterium]